MASVILFWRKNLATSSEPNANQEMVITTEYITIPSGRVAISADPATRKVSLEERFGVEPCSNCGTITHIAIAAQISIALGFIAEARKTVPGVTASSNPISERRDAFSEYAAHASRPEQTALVINRARRTE